DGVSVPPLNLAALLVGNEPQPAAGSTQSSGGNFADPVDPIQDAYGRGDLLPYTELQFPQPQDEEIIPGLIDEEPIVGENPPVQLDDDVFDGNPGGVGDDEDAVNQSGILSGSGGDGALTFALTGAVLPEGMNFAVASNDGSTLIISQNGVNVLQVVVDPATGEYTVTQLAPIQHPAGDDENNVQFTLNYSVTDSDGDVANGTLPVNVDDDTPVLGVNAVVQLDDDAFEGGNPGGVGDGPESANTSGTFAISTGADRPGTFELTGVTLPASGGFAIASNDGSTMIISQNGVDVLQIVVNSTTGAYTVTQLAPILHPDGDNENNVQFTVNYSLTDSDGDVANGALQINVNDDTPIANADALVTGAVDEDALDNANSTGNNDSAPGDDPDDADGDGDGTTTGGAAGSLAALFSVGADEPLSYGLLADTTSLENQNLTSQGHALLYVVSGTTLTAYADNDDGGVLDGGDTPVFTLEVNADGSWEFTLLDQLDHPATDDPETVATETAFEDNLLIDFSGVVSAADADGDTVTAAAG
ncbi:MAG: DUF5801 repeats-in-toxin domain-containing protein, partial [Novosphingobium sp.]